MKATWSGAVIAQSDDTMLVEGNHYFPAESLNRDFTSFSNHKSMCPWKGQASYYSLIVNGNVMWTPSGTTTLPSPRLKWCGGGWPSGKVSKSRPDLLLEQPPSLIA